MSTTNDTSNRAERFLEGLRKINHDRGKMAALRRGASATTARQAWPVIYGLGEDIGNLAACTIGALYAEHPEEDRNVFSFGTTCRRIAMDNGRMKFACPLARAPGGGQTASCGGSSLTSRQMTPLLLLSCWNFEVS